MKTIKIQKLLLLFIGVLLTITLNAQNKKNYKPKNLEEAITQLDILFLDSTKNQIIDLSEQEFLARTHFFTGMWIRNNWGLWRGGKLAKYFNNLGIYHPDDMSSIILTSYYRHLHNQDLKVEEQIKFYQDYWKELQEYNYRLINDTAFAQQEKNRYENSIRERNENLKQEFPIGSQVKTWVDYSFFGSRSEIMGEIVDWRTCISKYTRRLGSSTKGPQIQSEYLEAKIKVIKYIDAKKKKGIERYNHMENDEIWVNVNLIHKIE